MSFTNWARLLLTKSRSARRSPRVGEKRKQPQLEALEQRVLLDSVSERFISQVYPDVLGRSAAPVEAAAWGRLLDAGQSREQVSLSILNSREYLTNVAKD